MKFNTYRELLSHYAKSENYFELIDSMIEDAKQFGHEFDVMDDAVAYVDYHEYRLAEMEWTVMGICTDETWNGWERPAFTFSQAVAAAERISSDEWLDTTITFDSDRDCFVEECDGEVVDEAFGFDYDGLHVYMLGNGYMWEDCEEWM